MAMNFGSKCVRSFARRFVGGRGGGGDLESSTGLARASQIVRLYSTTSDESFDDQPSAWFFDSNTGRLCLASFVVTFFWAAYLRILTDRKDLARISILESDIALRRAIVEKGITRKMCEEKIAQLKQQTESSEHDRFVLQMLQGWLKVLPKDKSGAVGRGGSRISDMGVNRIVASQSSTQHGFFKSGIAASQSSTQHGFFQSGK